MDWNQLEGNWRQIRGRIRAKWAKLTDDDMAAIGGRKDQLVGKLQERYGKKREDLEREVDVWIRNL
jgi:uncharacterized protein YjbJ (UPF0337 family)